MGLRDALHEIHLWKTKVADFSPIAGCAKLELFDASDTPLTDLSIIKGMKLHTLLIAHTEVADLSPVAGMPLVTVNLERTPVKDLWPLLKCPTLKALVLPTDPENIESLHGLPNLARLSYSEILGGDPDKSADEFWAANKGRNLETLHANRGDWQGAVKAFASAKEQDPSDPNAYYYLAVAHLAADDSVGYRSVCEEMLGRFANTKKPYVAERIRYACVPAQQAVRDMRALIRVAKLGATLSNGNDRLVGAAMYRAGKFQDALEQFEASGRKGFQFNAWDCAFLAMIQHRLGNTAEATRRLDQTRQKSDMAEGWWEKVEVDHLIREADNLLSGQTPAAEKP